MGVTTPCQSAPGSERGGTIVVWGGQYAGVSAVRLTRVVIQPVERFGRGTASTATGGRRRR